MSRSRLIALVVVVVAVVAGAAWFLANRGPSGPSAAEASPTIPPVAASTTVTSDAKAVPVHHVELTAPGSGGVVIDVLVAEGDEVTAGEPLLKLDPSQAQAALDQAAAADGAAMVAVKQADAASAQARAQVDAARAAVDEADAAVKAADATRDGTPSGTDARRAANASVDQARASARAARAQLEASRAGAQGAEEALNAAKLDQTRTHAAFQGAQAALNELTVTAPIPGTVASLDATVGETVTPASPVARIADTSAWRFETIDLDEAAIGRLEVGANATITVDAFPGASIPARVSSISRFGVSSAGDIVYTVVLEPTGAVPDGLRWNMTSSAQIEAKPAAGGASPAPSPAS